MNFLLLLVKFRDQIFRGLVFIILGVFIIAVLAQFTNVPKTLGLTLQSLGRINLLVLIFLGFYYFLKFQVEKFLISKLKLEVTTKRIALLFVAAEMVREFPTIPILAAASAITKQGQKFFPLRMFAALTPQLPLEIAACFLILAAFGFANLPYLRLASALAVAATFSFLLFLAKIPITAKLTKSRGKFKRRIGKMLQDLKAGLVQILNFQNLITAFIPILLYMLCLGTILHLISLASSFETISLTNAWSAFALIYLATIFSPLPADWGVSESSGFAFLSLLGATPESALAAMLTFRIIFSTTTYLVVGSILWFLWSDIKNYLAGFLKIEGGFKLR